MNKSELIQKIHENLGDEATKSCAARALDAVLEGITAGIKTDKNVALIGFGTFSVGHRPAREGRNPKTGEKMQISASNTIKFKAGTGLKRLVQ